MKKILESAGPLVIIVALALMRLVPHVPNFAPITAIALFGGAYLGKRYAFVVPLLAMVLSDYLLLYMSPFGAHMLTFSHLYSPLAIVDSTRWAVYGSFALSGLVGLWLRTHKSPLHVVLATALCSVQFFLITNAAVWIGGMYDRSLIGLWESYVAGIPFFRGTLLGDFFYTCSLFGIYELALRYVRKKRYALAR